MEEMITTPTSYSVSKLLFNCIIFQNKGQDIYVKINDSFVCKVRGNEQIKIDFTHSKEKL